MLGLTTHIGRLWGDADENPSAQAVTVLSYRFYQQYFDGDRQILGTTLQLNDEPHTIVGVLAKEAEFENFWRDAAAFVPFVYSPSQLSWDHRIDEVIGRLAEGVTVEQAQAQMTTIAAQLAEAQPETNAEVRILVQPFTDYFYSPDDRLAMALLMLAVTYSVIPAIFKFVAMPLLWNYPLTEERVAEIQAELGANPTADPKPV